MTKARLVMCGVLLAVGRGGTVRAQAPTPVPAAAAGAGGWDFGARVGYAIPFGNMDGNLDQNLPNYFSGAIPLQLEAGYRVAPAVTVGAYVQYAFGQLKDNPPSGGCSQYGVTCSSSIVRLGVEGIYRFPSQTSFALWLGGGAGYEWMKIDWSGGEMFSPGSLRANGFEVIMLQGGGDFPLAPQMTVGPYVSLSIARYRKESPYYGAYVPSDDVSNATFHEWLQLGVRGSFGL
jgi:hypothetical protein